LKGPQVVVQSSPPAYEAFGAFVKSQRDLASLTLRQAAALARISNPYLSQIENGFALPSITVLTDLAAALSVSVEILLLRAVGVEPGRDHGVVPRTEEAIRHDPRLTDTQRRAMLGVLVAFMADPASAAEPSAAATPPPATAALSPATRARVTAKSATSRPTPPKPRTTTAVPKQENKRKRVTPHD
jgi:transcriptional regulator with XRE-family HTH domain